MGVLNKRMQAIQMVNRASKALDDEKVYKALQEMALENIDNLDSFAEFIETLIRHDGDLERIVGVTHEPVDVNRFMDDDYFLGLGDQIYPEVRAAIKTIIEGGYIEALLMGAVGIGKSTLAQIVTAYHLYLLSCEKWPQAKFGLMPTSTIVIAMLNRSDYLAQQVTYGEFRSFMENVPYFNEHYPFIRDKKSEMEFPKGRVSIIASAAFNNKLLGMNIIGGCVDEMNFMQVVERSKQSREGGEFNQAKAIYNALVRRRKSRFATVGKMPGCLCMISSKGGPDDFTELRVKEVQTENDDLTYIWDKPQWDVVPADRFSGKKFFVEVGTERTNSRIIDDPSDAMPGAKVLTIPVEMKIDFERDMEGSLRDFAGISTLSKRPFFYSRESIWNCGTLWEHNQMDSPFGDVHEIVVSDETLPQVLKDYKIIRPFAPRFIHVDLAIKGDACGLSCGHVADVIPVKSKGRHGELVIEDLPVVAYDVVLRLVPPRGGEIEISLVRKVIYMLRDAGLPVKMVTFDQFQSSDSQQILRRAGMRSEHLSVDGTKSKEAYSGLRSGMFGGRVWMHEYDLAFREIAQLEEDDKGVIDHPTHSSKDVADSICGVYTALMRNRSTWRAVREQGSQENRRPSPPRPIGRPSPVRPKGRRILEAADGDMPDAVR